MTERVQCFFLDRNDGIVFIRDDAVSFVVSEEELELNCSFPIDPDKPITQGMKIAFDDIDGNMVFYEIRTAEENAITMTTVIYAEYAPVAELVEELIPDKKVTAATAEGALSAVLSDTRWQVRSGTTQTATASLRFFQVNCWEAVKQIQEKWQVDLVFSCEIDGSGIINRYVEVREIQHVNRGKRFDIRKDMSALTVLYDDSQVCTALYGLGSTIDSDSTSEEDSNYQKRITFASVSWAISKGNPADKPSGQVFVEDPQATAAYGRNGRKRSQWIEFDNCESPAELLTLTWNALQQVNKPKVTIKATVADLERIWGYQHEAVRKGDIVTVIADDTNTQIEATVVDIKRDYIHPDLTKITIGSKVITLSDITADYQAKTKKAQKKADAAYGYASSNAARIDDLDDDVKQFETRIDQTDYNISLIATETDLATMKVKKKSILGITADSIDSLVTRVGDAESAISQAADKISLVVSSGQGGNSINAASIIAAINGQTGESKVSISADVIDINGLITALESQSLGVGDLSVEGNATFLKGIYSEDSISTDESLFAGFDIQLAGASMKDCIKNMSLTFDSDTNQYTLTWYTYNDANAHTANFSRAASATKVSGSWSGSTYTATPDPNGTASAVTTVNLVAGSWAYDESLGKYQLTMQIKDEGGNPRDTDYADLPTIVCQATSFNSSHKATVNAYVSGDTDHPVSVSGLVVDASGVYTTGYRTGSQAVTLTGSWSEYQGTGYPTSRVITVSTSGRVNTAGNPDELSKAYTLSLSKGGWSGGQNLVSLKVGNEVKAQVAVAAPTQRSVDSVDPVTLTSSDTSDAVSKTISFTYDNDDTGSASVTIKAYAVYKAGVDSVNAVSAEAVLNS